MDSTTFNIMLAVEILTFVVVGGGSTYWGPLVGAVVLSLLPEFLRTLREWLELLPVSMTNFYPGQSRSTISCTASSISRTPSG